MSKRLKNYPEPGLVIDKYGADAIRLYMLHSPAVKADDMCFSEKGVELVMRQVFLPMWNAYSFFITYARIYDWKPAADVKAKPEAEMDRWILSTLNKLITDVEQGMDAYDLSRAVEPFVGFIDQLTNWYIRRCRRRFWADEQSLDRDQAFQTLYTVLLELSKVAAPFLPFTAEMIYLNLRSDELPESVHLCDFPEVDQSARDESLEQSMASAQTTVSLGHALRKEHKLKVRQPLATAHLASRDPSILQALKLKSALIAEELNVKSVELHAEEEQFVTLQAKANFRTLGRRVGKHMRAVQARIESFDKSTLQNLLDGQGVSIDVDGESIELAPEDVLLSRQVKDGMVASNQGAITIVLDTALNDDLLSEGMAREIVNKINTMRREADFDVTDRVKVRIDSSERVREAFVAHQAYITSEVLALDVQFLAASNGTEDTVKTWDLNGEEAEIALQRVPVEA
jgi:isoleucyl-tRNA synthetase